MDVESVHSANSHRSHSKNVNNNDLASRQFSHFDSQSYPRPMNPGTVNNFPGYQYQNNALQMFHPPFYTYNPALINNNFVFNPTQVPNNAGYVPASILQNNGYGDCYNNPLPSDFGDSEKIQVQIVPQDDNWGADTCTAITSETGGSAENLGVVDGGGNHLVGSQPPWDCVTVLCNVVFALLCALCLISPVAMVTMPSLPWLQWSIVIGCGPSCEAQLIALAAKMLILTIGTVALHCRHRQYAVARISLFRAFVLALALVIVFSYWLFYAVRILDKRHNDMASLVTFAASLVDSLLFVHYLALLLLEVRHLQVVFYVKVTRSPDGATRFYRLGRQSLQSAAVHVLQNYVTDFPDYNYDLVQCLRRKCHKRYHSKHTNTPNDTPDKKTKYKVYSIDPGLADPKSDSPAVVNIAETLSPGSGGGIKIGTGTSARLYEETEWEKKFRKRQMRLLVAVEEAFGHVQSIESTNGGGGHSVDEATKNMASLEAAQTILPAIMKPLQKLLRVSRRHLSYSSGIVIDHIAHCLVHKLSPKYLVQQFSPNLTVLDSLLLSDTKAGEKTNPGRQQRIYLSWTVICDRLLSKGLTDGVSFQLKPRDCRNDQLCLMCTVHRVPFFSLEEKPFVESQCRFVLHSNSETSV